MPTSQNASKNSPASEADKLAQIRRSVAMHVTVIAEPSAPKRKRKPKAARLK